MSTPAIQYSGPAISEEVPWETRRHLQLLYQKLGNHTQAFRHIALQLNGVAAKATGTSSTIVDNGGSVPISLGAVNDQSGATSYTTGAGDDGILLILNDASPVAVTLNSQVNAPFYLTATNFGTGLVTATPTTGTINGNASFSIPDGGLSILSFDGTNWHASSIMALPSGLSVTITTAKLTTGGANGSQTFSNGILTSQVAAS